MRGIERVELARPGRASEYAHAAAQAAIDPANDREPRGSAFVRRVTNRESNRGEIRAHDGSACVMPGAAAT